MKRRDFLIMAFGAGLALPLAGETTAAAERKRQIIEKLQTALSEIALEFVDGDDEYRQHILSGIDESIAKAKTENGREYVVNFRDALLAYQAKEASE